MKLSGDLPTKWIYVKAALFLFIGLMAGGGLLLQSPSWRTALLLGLCVWACCRLYYFAFYVVEHYVEHYVDAGFKFVGLSSLAAYVWRGRKRRQ